MFYFEVKMTGAGAYPKGGCREFVDTVLSNLLHDSLFS
jgi:hypothetical protein